MQRLVIIALLLVVTLVSVSAYLRLSNSGIGCDPWPACYGSIGTVAETQPTVGSTYERLAEDARQPLSWATPIHRLVASVLGLTILAMTLVALRLKRDRVLSLALLAMTLFLAWLGIHSAGLHSPAIVMGNLLGGFIMLGLLGWMTFRGARPGMNAPTPLKQVVVAAIVMVSLQIVLGGLTSANFAASACRSIPDCQGSYLPGMNLPRAFDLSRTHEVGPDGFVLGGTERQDIHKLHRIGAVITTILVLLSGVLALRFRMGAVAAVIVLLAGLELAVGVAAVVAEIPLTVAVAHNWLAAMLLLSLLRLLALCNNRQAPS